MRQKVVILPTVGRLKHFVIEHGQENSGTYLLSKSESGLFEMSFKETSYIVRARFLPVQLPSDPPSLRPETSFLGAK